MTVFILVSILLVATLAIALLVGFSLASPKVKVQTMYVGAALMLAVALVICDYIDTLLDFPSKFRFHAVLVVTVAVSYLCIAIACMGNSRMFSEEEQKAILASIYAFAKHHLILPSSITIQPNEMCIQQELMYYVHSAFSNIPPKRSDIVSFLFQFFKAYFPSSESVISKKIPGLDKVKERRERKKENKSKFPDTY